MYEMRDLHSLIINDCHIHLGISSQINQYYTPEHLLTYGFTKGNLLVFSTDVNPDKNNMVVKELAQQAPNIYGLYYITKDDLPGELTVKMLGGKFHGAYNDAPVSSGIYHHVMEYIESKGAWLMVHCGRYLEGSRRSNTSYIHALDVAKTYPGIKVIMAHMGGTDTTVCKNAIVDSRDEDNVYFDTSGITTPSIIEFALKHVNSDRILFGSDSPWCSFNAMYYTVMDAQIPLEDKMNIMQFSFDKLLAETLVEWRYVPTFLREQEKNGQNSN